MIVPVVLNQSLCVSLFYTRSKHIYLNISPEKALKILLDFEMEILYFISVNCDSETEYIFIKDLLNLAFCCVVYIRYICYTIQIIMYN